MHEFASQRQSGHPFLQTPLRSLSTERIGSVPLRPASDTPPPGKPESKGHTPWASGETEGASHASETPSRAPIKDVVPTDPASRKLHDQIESFHKTHITSSNLRNILDMRIKPGIGGPLASVGQLAKARSVAIVVGFRVPVPTDDKGYTGVPETDGPLGAAFIALACQQTKKPFAVICDRGTARLVEACLEQLGGSELVDATQLITYEARGKDSAQASRDVDHLLTQKKADTVVAIEVAGQNRQGKALSMRGIDITHLNPDFDALLGTIGRSRKIIAIGDGGNEAGFGGSMDGVPKALNGDEMQARTGADYVVPATVSNWGGYFLYSTLVRLAGKDTAMPSRDQHDKAVQAMLSHGGVDGCTLSSRLGLVDDKGRTTGVDGMPVKASGDVYEASKTFALHASEAGFSVGTYQDWNEPMLVSLFDSSDGVLYAAKVALPYIEAQLPGQKTYLLFGDHGNAPYGTKAPEQIESLVHSALTTLDLYSSAPVVMACNTACIALGRMEERGVELMEINLVKNTADMIRSDGFARVGVLATPAMAKSGLYQGLLREAYAQPGKALHAQGCDRWADLVNASEHLSTDPKTSRKVDDLLKAALAPLPKDLDAIYLCCTHYPALTRRIADTYKALQKAAGVDKPFSVVNPMKRQAELATSIYHTKRSDFEHSGAVIRRQVPIVILTSGDPKEVRETARRVLGRDDLEAHHQPNPGPQISVVEDEPTKR